jgi:dynein light chain roadblock-type
MADVMLVEDTEKRLRSHKGVIGFMVMTTEGLAVRSTLGEGETLQYAALVSRYAEKCRACTKRLSEDDELQLVRIRSAKHEIVIAPDYCSGSKYLLVVVQDPTVPKKDQ